ncbi:sonic hedgehog protein-like [Saccostrea echinata]|uniref:sonic hedgehog protein-like n=1 Tax=Saccostrea echinata TaxID=191078 RepID=UPI002A8409A2|nr:sonic hedgehog protein-like [Saccostrea echinata]
MRSTAVLSALQTAVFAFLILTGSSLQCASPRGSGRRHRTGNRTPLVYKQHVPNVSENTLGASGLAEGRITRDDPKFKKLVTNDNPDIIFRDEEGDGSDRIMTQRCKDKLKILAISVMNTWQGIKLRVTEAWDDDGHHAKDSLHYEGRAVDITTSDKDRAKYGTLAKLAVEAGFDWVYFESRGHIHCSVKSDSSAAIKIGGCFPPLATVYTEHSGTKSMEDLQVGDKVLSLKANGKLGYSEVVSFLDKDQKRSGLYFTITTSDLRTITLTDRHLIYTSITNSSSIESFVANYAQTVQTGQFVLINDGDSEIRSSLVTHVTSQTVNGVYAPLTYDGTIVVNGVVTSCYGVINSELIAHFSCSPLRWFHTLSKYIPFISRDTEQDGVHWYAEFLYSMGRILLSPDLLYIV